ncbi:MAG TPA: PE family protein [Mycobacterium sp.]
MTGFLNVDPAAVGLSSITESVISGEMAAGTAAGSAALVGTVPMVPSADDAAFTAALNGAGATYLASASQHVGERMAFAGAQNISALTYVLNEVLSSASIAGI